MTAYLFEMRNIVKKFSGVAALDGVDLAVSRGECVGLCGENGAGKSTLMKVLSGVYPHGTWEGEILWEGKSLQARSVRDTERAGIVIIHQELMLVPQLTVAENIFLGNEITSAGGRMDYLAMHRQAERLMDRLKLKNVNVGTPVMDYGGGYQQLFEIARALAKDAKLLILDEPTSSLTVKETDVLLSIIEDLKREGVACIYISHKLEEVARICDTVTVIRDGKHVVTKPMSQLSTGDIITSMVGREMTQLFPRQEHAIGEVIFEASDINCWDVTNPDRKRVDGVSFKARRGEILGIAGLVGAGRTELVMAIFGAYRGRHSGASFLEGSPLDNRSPRHAIRDGLCLVPEDRKKDGIVPLLAVGSNITLATLQRYSRNGRIDQSVELATVQEAISKLRVKTAGPQQSIAGLSGGNQQKAVLTKMILPLPKVLILDEPTRGVDVGSKYDIYVLIAELAAQGVTIIMVSSELPEVLGISDRVLVMCEGRITGDFANKGLTQEQVLTAAIGNSSAALSTIAARA